MEMENTFFSFVNTFIPSFMNVHNYTSFRVAMRGDDRLSFEVHMFVETEKIKLEKKIGKLFPLTNVNSDIVAVTYRRAIVFLSWYQLHGWRSN